MIVERVVEGLEGGAGTLDPLAYRLGETVGTFSPVIPFIQVSYWETVRLGLILMTPSDKDTIDNAHRTA
ncbi:MAG: hypothetical protein M0Z30_21190, partial [Actinomycetota bacterium]|nr:hypothetical protein [Actinomycetota bacterium]